MAPRPLLAKSYRGSANCVDPPRFASLLEHSRDVPMCGKTLFEVVGDDALIAMGLPPERRALLRSALIANGWVQDTGKANSHFEQLVTTNPQISQLLRHEHISAVLFHCYEPLRSWFSALPEDLRTYALWGAVGHHRKFGIDTKPRSGTVQVYLSHPDFRQILGEMAADLGLGPPPEFSKNLTVVDTRAKPGCLDAARSLGTLRQEFSALETRFEEDQPRRELALVKGLGIAADVAASALGRGQPSSVAVGNAVRELLDTNISPDDIERLLQRWAWRELENNHDPKTVGYPPSFKEFRLFQRNVGASTAMVTLAQAGCGSGKSAAAYLWAKAWSERRRAEHRTFRLFFCLPTTGTTTEHFKDYALECGVESSLAHSRAKVDLTFLAETAGQEEITEETSDAAQAALLAARAKIDALALWSTPLVVSTTDTVLGLMANARKPVCAFPAILQSGIVFDEVHAFDEVLFGHLLMFLKNFPGIPVLLMTASLPEARLAALRAIRPELACIPGPEEQETRRRHVIQRCDTPEPWQEIEVALECGKRVLWLCNQVERANERWQEARERFGKSTDVYLYHSRYKYRDRSRLHRRVIDSFKNPKRGVLLIATQVAEMSLNLSAQLLVTDLAPVPSLIQRLGRHLRNEGEKGPGPVLVCALPGRPGAEKPYGQEELAAVDAWLDQLVSREEGVHQRELAEAFAATELGSAVDLDAAERMCGFFGYPHVEGLWRTVPGVTRADGYTVSVIFPDDLAKCTALMNGEPSADWLREHEVSVPVKPEMVGWRKVSTALVAQGGLTYEFDQETLTGKGARWQTRLATNSMSQGGRSITARRWAGSQRPCTPGERGLPRESKQRLMRRR